VDLGAICKSHNFNKTD